VKKAIAAPGAKAVLVNIWASWCGPCRDEFPDVLKIRRDSRRAGRACHPRLGRFRRRRRQGRCREVPLRHGSRFPLLHQGGKDEEFIDGLAKEWTGTLPATLVYDGKGELRDLREGKQSYETFRGMVEKVLKDGSRPAS
jgi:thiol-disulfide isomerase/thioredoxin